MVIINLKQLMVKKSAQGKRRIYYKDISEATGITISTLSRIANEPKHNISKDHIEKLCAYFGVTPDELMTIIPDPPEK
ncbi:MAG: helix-turn-helix transcriptional regulator [Candidatus Izemoplasmatales bacterium]|nr:helix-turn-helix transcriptional regulator [Candidatus Izemoplasmatales bacterium]